MDLRLHPGKHVDVNLEGKTVGGVFVESETWVTGVVVGTDSLGIRLTVELDVPYGGGQPHGLRKRPAEGQRLISIELDHARENAAAAEESQEIPESLVALARAGKDLKFVKAYRELNGATLDEARAVLHRLAPPDST